MKACKLGLEQFYKKQDTRSSQLQRTILMKARERKQAKLMKGLLVKVEKCRLGSGGNRKTTQFSPKE